MSVDTPDIEEPALIIVIVSPTFKLPLPVKNFVNPTEFKFYKELAEDLGFIHVESGPLVRSSYKAQKHIT